MKAIYILQLALIAFVIGWFANSSSAILQGGKTRQMTAGISMSAPERASPHDWIKQERIRVYDNKVIIYINNPEWAMFTNTNSMDPVLDETANAIEIVPKGEKDIHVGDIASYKSRSGGVIIHRVIKTGTDDKGWYATFKGDNNPVADPERVRFSQIERVVVAIIY